VLRLELDPFRKLWSLRRMTYDTRRRAVALSPDESTCTSRRPTTRPWRARAARLSDSRRRHAGAFAVLHVFGRDHRGEHRGIEACAPTAKATSSLRRMEKKRPRTARASLFPAGAILESHPVPSDQPMNCAFGDADLASLYVTTAAGELLRASDCGRRGAVKLAAWLMLAAIAPGNALAQSYPAKPIRFIVGPGPDRSRA